MAEFAPVTVDVRDMLCAQALAVVAKAIERFTPGERLDVLTNAEDVRHDLIVWAKSRGYTINANNKHLVILKIG